MRFKSLLLGLLLVVGLLTLRSDVGACPTINTSYDVDNGCVDLWFGPKGNCTFTIDRRDTSGSTWVTLSTNASQPFHDCPPDPGHCYEYRISCNSCPPVSFGVICP